MSYTEQHLAEATEILIHALKSTKSNAELLLTGLRG